MIVVYHQILEGESHHGIDPLQSIQGDQIKRAGVNDVLHWFDVFQIEARIVVLEPISYLLCLLAGLGI